MAIRVALHHRTHLPLRPARQPGAARDPAAAGAALPHADPRLLADGHAGRSTSSTGSRIRTATGSRGSCSPSRRDELEIAVDLVADMTVINPFDFFVEPYAEHFPFAYAPALAKELIPFLETEPLGAAARGVARRRSGRRSSRARTTVQLLVRLNQQLQQQIRYLVRMEPGVQTPDETLAQRERARAATRLAAGADPAPSRARRALRLGLPHPARRRREVARRARRAPSATSPTCTRGPRSTCPGAGWIGLDPTSGLLAGEGHIPLACTADPGQRGAGDRLHRSRARSSSSFAMR